MTDIWLPPEGGKRDAVAVAEKFSTREHVLAAVHLVFAGIKFQLDDLWTMELLEEVLTSAPLQYQMRFTHARGASFIRRFSSLRWVFDAKEEMADQLAKYYAQETPPK